MDRDKINVISITWEVKEIENDWNTSLKDLISWVVKDVEWITFDDVNRYTEKIDWKITFIIREKWEK